MKTLILAMFIGLCAWSQTATVVKIGKADAADAKAKYDAYIAAKAEFEAAEKALKEKWLSVQAECYSLSTWDATAVTGTVSLDADGDVVLTPKPKKTFCQQVRQEFSCGVEFSPDFKFAVPKACPKFDSTLMIGGGHIDGNAWTPGNVVQP
jgi:hypothetical protein